MRHDRNKSNKLYFLFYASALTLVLAGYGVARSAEGDYPTRPVSIIHPFSAGGSNDLALRLASKEAEKFLGQPIVVVNKPGGGGVVGLSAVVVAKPDGYTLGQGPGIGSVIIMPHLEKLPYHPLKDVKYIMQFFDLDFGVVVKADSPFKSLKEVIAYARQNPKKVTYGTNAPNSISNLTLELIARKEGIQLTHIPFKSSPELQTALLGGHVTFVAGQFNYSLVESGETRILAYLGDKHPDKYFQVPILKDLGYDITCPAPPAVFGPAGLPDEIVKKIDNAFMKAMEEPAFIKGMKDLRLTIRYRNSKDLTDYIAQSYEIFGNLLKEMGLAKP